MRFNFLRHIAGYALVTLSLSVFLCAGVSHAEEENVEEADGGVPIAKALIAPGTYVPTGTSPLDQIVVKSWMNKTLIEGVIRYAGHPFKFSVEVKPFPETPDAFIANGNFVQPWSNGINCTIPIKFEIQREPGKLYLRTYTPASIAAQAPAGQECRRYTNYVWTMIDRPYVFSYVE